VALPIRLPVAVPRPVLLAILGLALCVAAFVAVRGLGDNSDGGPTPAPIPEPAPAPTIKPNPGAAATPTTPAKPAAPAKKAPAQAATPKPAAPKPAAPKPARKLSPAEVAKLKDQAVALSVSRALDEKDVVVLLFSRPGGADDALARRAVDSLRGTKGVQVFAPRFEDLESYRPILAGVGVSQVPSIVIATPGHKAKLLEGYVDSQTLRQQVEDSLR
jgi:hypothetical protein